MSAIRHTDLLAKQVPFGPWIETQTESIHGLLAVPCRPFSRNAPSASGSTACNGSRRLDDVIESDLNRDL
jgi:hypothetical protein